MVDHVRTLLLNPSDVSGYRHVTDAPSDNALRILGIAGDGSEQDVSRVDSLMPIVLSDDLVRFRRFFDPRLTPVSVTSVYRMKESELSQVGLYDQLFSGGGMWKIGDLFRSTDPDILANLDEMRIAAMSMDSSFALGSVLLACAYRRWCLQ